jgi:hypothetical protein
MERWERLEELPLLEDLLRLPVFDFGERSCGSGALLAEEMSLVLERLCEREVTLAAEDEKDDMIGGPKISHTALPGGHRNTRDLTQRS